MYSIGHYKLSSILALAPMAGLTDLPFRQLCRSLGAGLATSEMLSSDIGLWHTQKSTYRLPRKDEMSPRIIQIAGNNPSQMAEAAVAICQKGADIIDINMGCPAKKVCKKAAGSALLRDTRLVDHILSAVSQSVDIPVTLKIRTGWADSEKNAIQIANIAEKNNIAALFVHGRTKAQKFNGYAEYETIRQIKRNSNIPIIANGDITNTNDLSFILDYTQADGLMLGRSILGQPWRFDELNYFLNTQKVHPGYTVNNMITIMVNHVHEIHNYYPGKKGVFVARGHIGHYLDILFKRRLALLERHTPKVTKKADKAFVERYMLARTQVFRSGDRNQAAAFEEAAHLFSPINLLKQVA